MKVIAAAANFSFALMLGVLPAPEKINELMPFIQASAFTAMAVNHGVQLARNLKDIEL